jgi:hypothetical protein
MMPPAAAMTAGFAADDVEGSSVIARAARVIGGACRRHSSCERAQRRR